MDACWPYQYQSSYLVLAANRGTEMVSSRPARRSDSIQTLGRTPWQPYLQLVDIWCDRPRITIAWHLLLIFNDWSVQYAISVEWSMAQHTTGITSPWLLTLHCAIGWLIIDISPWLFDAGREARGKSLLITCTDSQDWLTGREGGQGARGSFTLPSEKKI